ncbi:hypothetical protein AB0M02_22705 [Actinoplanes sp. NPDC051861]|uniref:hypothetical protein n=1 Tax=Actinoplanes sp. NPDC051861 TaxID=3155170 RepID=UPI00343A2339
MTITYYARLRGDETVRRPGAVLRRRPGDAGGTVDEIYRHDGGWEPTTLIRDADPENDDDHLVEISDDLAQRVIARWEAALTEAERQFTAGPPLRLAEAATPAALPAPSAALPASERPKVVAFLRDAPLALSAFGTGEDPYDGDLPVVPLHIHTDGVWVWSESLAYFAERYGLPPEPELLAHIRARGYRWSEVDDQTLQHAGRLVFGDG